MSMISSYTEAMRASWLKDPKSVDPSWKKYFETPGVPAAVATGTATINPKEIDDNLKVERLMRAFLVRGHAVCDLDPLGILSANLDSRVPDEV